MAATVNGSGTDDATSALAGVADRALDLEPVLRLLRAQGPALLDDTSALLGAVTDYVLTGEAHDA